MSTSYHLALEKSCLLIIRHKGSCKSVLCSECPGNKNSLGVCLWKDLLSYKEVEQAARDYLEDLREQGLTKRGITLGGANIGDFCYFFRRNLVTQGTTGILTFVTEVSLFQRNHGEYYDYAVPLMKKEEIEKETDLIISRVKES